MEIPPLIPQSAPRTQDEFAVFASGRGDLIPGFIFRDCTGIIECENPIGPVGSGYVLFDLGYDPITGLPLSIEGNYTYRADGLSRGVLAYEDLDGRRFEILLEFEPSGTVKATITDTDGVASVWAAMPHLDFALGSQTILLPIPPSWSAAIATEADVAPEEWGGIPSRLEAALFGNALDRFFGPWENGSRLGLFRSSYKKTGPNRGVLTVEFEEFDPDKNYEGLTDSQVAAILGSTWIFDLTFTSDESSKYTLTITKEGHLPTVIDGFLDLVDDRLNLLDEFPNELLLPDDPPQASGEDVSGVEVAAATTNYTIGADDVQTFLMSNTGAAYQRGGLAGTQGWWQPKDDGRWNRWNKPACRSQASCFIRFRLTPTAPTDP